MLQEREWRARAAAHSQRVRSLLEPGFLKKRERHEKNEKWPSGADGFWGLDPVNPIYNFLLRYYNIRGASGTRRLARWSPGLHVVLEGADMERDVEGKDAVLNPRALIPAPSYVGVKGMMYDPTQFMAGSNASSWEWYRELLRVTQHNPPVLNCFGLHEWAMQVFTTQFTCFTSAKVQILTPKELSAVPSTWRARAT